MSILKLAESEIEAAVAEGRAAVDAVVAALPFRATPTYADVAAMVEAGMRHVLATFNTPPAEAPAPAVLPASKES